MPNLYEIASTYKEQAARLMDAEFPEEIVADTLESMSGEFEVKATNVAMFIRNLEADASAIKDAEKRMAERRKSIENRAVSLTEYLHNNMQACGISKIDSPYFVVSIKQNPERVVIDAESQLPEQFMRTPPAPAPQPDKDAIKAAIKSGSEVPGAHLERGTRLEIK